MRTEDSIVVITGLFIIGMTWLRTRMHYAKRGGGSLHLEPAGRIYFACVVASLAAGWPAAPLLGRALWPDPAVTATFLRVVWFLSIYFIFIVIHRVLLARGVSVFGQRDLPHD
jgi:hypothetical protein